MNPNNLKVGDYRKQESDKMLCEMCQVECDLLWDLPQERNQVKKVCESCYMSNYMEERDTSGGDSDKNGRQP